MGLAMRIAHGALFFVCRARGRVQKKRTLKDAPLPVIDLYQS